MVITTPSNIRTILTKRLLIILIFSHALLMGCSREIPANPMCRITPESPELAPAKAACLIKLDGKLLALKFQGDNHWHLPIGKAQKSTSAQCTAHQTVWKNTGLNVEVGALLFTSQDKVQHFACHVTDELAQQLTAFPVPEWANRQVTQVDLIDPFNIPKDQWPATVNLIEVRQAFIKIKAP